MSTCTPAQLQDIGCQNQERAAVKEGKEQLKSRLGKKVAGAVDDDWQQAPAPPDLSLTPVCLCLQAGQTQWLFPSETGTSCFARKNFVFASFAVTLDPGCDSTMAPPCLLVGHWLSQSQAESAFQLSLSCR